MRCSHNIVDMAKASGFHGNDLGEPLELILINFHNAVLEKVMSAVAERQYSRVIDVLNKIEALKEYPRL